MELDTISLQHHHLAEEGNRDAVGIKRGVLCHFYTTYSVDEDINSLWVALSNAGSGNSEPLQAATDFNGARTSRNRQYFRFFLLINTTARLKEQEL